MEPRRHPEQELLFKHIDEAIIPPTMEEALMEAVERGDMTKAEIQDYLAAYEDCFLRSKEIYPE